MAQEASRRLLSGYELEQRQAEEEPRQGPRKKVLKERAAIQALKGQEENRKAAWLCQEEGPQAPQHPGTPRRGFPGKA